MKRVSGGIILAPGGINGSICGIRDSVERVIAFIESDSRLKGLRKIESLVSPEEEAIHHGHTSSSPLAAGEDAPFRWDHVRVKLKKEIVTLGMPSVSPIEKVGKYMKPREWNSLITDPDTVVIDVRNNYEIRIGKFKGEVDPCTSAFRDFPSWVDDNFELPEADSYEKLERCVDWLRRVLLKLVVGHEDPRVTLRIGDGVAFLKVVPSGNYDAVCWNGR
ncbi:Rhodanese-like domain-containing protein 7 [Linum perenne]